jgi:hypothetical protein
MIAVGLAEAHGWTDERIAGYLDRLVGSGCAPDR